jgi:hypothetical protein
MFTRFLFTECSQSSATIGSEELVKVDGRSLRNLVSMSTWGGGGGGGGGLLLLLLLLLFIICVIIWKNWV